MWLLELLSVCDWISPAIGAWQDARHFATGVHGTFSISVHKGELREAKKVLGKSSNNGKIGPTNVISTTMVAFDDEAMITIECYGGDDGYGSVREAMAKLNSKSIECWVNPKWA